MSAEGSPTGTGDGGGEAAEQEASVSEAEIAVHWREEESYPTAGGVRSAGERE